MEQMYEVKNNSICEMGCLFRQIPLVGHIDIKEYFDLGLITDKLTKTGFKKHLPSKVLP